MTRKGLWAVLGALGAIVVFGGGVRAGENNRNVPKAAIAKHGWDADLRHVVRFTTTTASANVQFFVSTMTVGSLTYSTATYGGSFDPTLATSTSTTYGGRDYMILQIVDIAGTGSFVAVDLNTVNISTNTSPRLAEGDWWSPDDPISWQGPVGLMSPSTFTATGWIYFQRPRTP